jgi:hypothetical protein
MSEIEKYEKTENAEIKIEITEIKPEILEKEISVEEN